MSVNRYDELLRQLYEKDFVNLRYTVFNFIDSDGYVNEISALNKAHYGIDDFEFIVFDISDEDKKDVIDNKSKYTLDEIESKLSVICRRKKVNFQNNDSTKDVVTTFNLHSLEENEVSSLPAWLKAVEDHGHSNN